MANKTISQLTAKTTLATTDVFPVEDTEDTKKVTMPNLAKAVVETYNGSTLAGTAQSVKAAIDRLNSNALVVSGTDWTSSNDLDTIDHTCIISYGTSVPAHAPSTANYAMVITIGGIRASTYIMMQLAYTSGNHVYIRRRYGTTSSTNWTAWREIDTTALAS